VTHAESPRIFGDHYIRNDGRVYSAAGGPQTLITVAGGAPLDGVVEGVESQYHACARRAEGSVWCWATGANQYPEGELGDGTMTWPATSFVATQVEADPGDAGVTKYLTNVTALMNDSFNVYGRPDLRAPFGQDDRVLGRQRVSERQPASHHRRALETARSLRVPRS